jgi:hypothetical protein
MAQVIFILSIFSTTFLFLPFALAIFYWIKKGFFFDKRVNFIIIYISVTVLLHSWATFLAFNSINNLFLFRTMNYVELFFLGSFLISFSFKSSISRFVLVFVLLGTIFLIDLSLGLPGTSPNEQVSAVSIILIWLFILASKKINYSDERGKAYSYFLLAIAIGALNNLSINFSEIAPELFAFIISIANIACYILYSIGFYILIKKPSLRIIPIK